MALSAEDNDTLVDNVHIHGEVEPQYYLSNVHLVVDELTYRRTEGWKDEKVKLE